MLRYVKHVDRVLAGVTAAGETRRLDGWDLAAGPLRAAASAAATELEPLLRAYGQDISAPDMAVSLPCAALLAVLCRTAEPRRILDAGSGFSSYVLRRYVPSGAEVWSVDDDPDWLGRTRQYLSGHEMADDRLLLWDAFVRSDVRDLHLAFIDFGNARAYRASILPEVCDRLSDGGVVLLDDFHKHRYRVAARRILAVRGLSVCPLRSWTLDGLGRFAAIARRAA